MGKRWLLTPAIIFPSAAPQLGTGISISLLCCRSSLADINASINLVLQVVNLGSRQAPFLAAHPALQHEGGSGSGSSCQILTLTESEHWAGPCPWQSFSRVSIGTPWDVPAPSVASTYSGGQAAPQRSCSHPCLSRRSRRRRHWRSRSRSSSSSRRPCGGSCGCSTASSG